MLGLPAPYRAPGQCALQNPINHVNAEQRLADTPTKQIFHIAPSPLSSHNQSSPLLFLSPVTANQTTR